MTTVRQAVFIDLSNFYSRLVKSDIGEPRQLRDYFLYWLDLDLLAFWLTNCVCPVWVFYSGRRIGNRSERIENQFLLDYIKRINRLPGVTASDVNIPGSQREPVSAKCEKCGETLSGTWESEKGVDASLIVHMFDTCSYWDRAVLISGDADYTPAVRSFRRNGKVISGAGFSATSESLIREFFDFRDLGQDIIRDDFAAYLLFGKQQLVEKWLTDSVSDGDALSTDKAVTLKIAWMEKKRDGKIHLRGIPFYDQSYVSVLLEDTNLAKDHRCAHLRDTFHLTFPRLSDKTKRKYLVSPLSWARVKREFPRLLPLYEANSNDEAGQMQVIYVRDENGYSRKDVSTGMRDE